MARKVSGKHIMSDEESVESRLPEIGEAATCSGKFTSYTYRYRLEIGKKNIYHARGGPVAENPKLPPIVCLIGRGRAPGG